MVAMPPAPATSSMAAPPKPPTSSAVSALPAPATSSKSSLHKNFPLFQILTIQGAVAVPSIAPIVSSIASAVSSVLSAAIPPASKVMILPSVSVPAILPCLASCVASAISGLPTAIQSVANALPGLTSRFPPLRKSPWPQLHRRQYIISVQDAVDFMASTISKTKRRRVFLYRDEVGFQ